MIHTFNLNGYNFAVDGNSGSIHLLDDISYNIIKEKQELPLLGETIRLLRSQYPEADILEAYQEILALIDEGMLFTSVSELEKAASAEKTNRSVKALCLHISHDCNLRCEYCFASKGDYKTGRSMMSKEIALRAVDYLVKNSCGRRNIEIDFFGGEPLMNFEIVKAVVAYGREIESNTKKRFYFTMTTNGTLLNDEKIDFINQNMDNIVISIDGRKEIHDSVRHDVSGKGSYDRIVPLAQKLVSGREGKSYFIRGTFTNRNKDFSKDVFHLADLGFEEISVEPVVGTGDELFLKEFDIPDILDEYECLAVQYLHRLSQGANFRFYHFNLDLYHGPCLFKRITACGAGYEYLAVSPDGNLYPCHQFVGENRFVIGNIFDGICDKAMAQEFMDNNILTKRICSDCWAKLFCSGGCHANAFFTNGEISKPNEINCIFQKKRIECAIMIQSWLKANQATGVDPDEDEYS